MEATAWRNNSLTTATYGIRVGSPNRDRYFTNRFNSIEVEIDDQVHTFKLTASFWKKCPEFRDSGSTTIRDWIYLYYTLDWPTGQPPRFELHALGNNRFRLGD